tara:strand:- start:2090 stop:2428 length:339 start_codon:yes stop_codon:yes gene_type:complete
MEFDSREDRLTISIWLNAMLRADTQTRYDMLSIYDRIYAGECIFEIRKDYSDSEGSGIITYFGRKANRMKQMPSPEAFFEYFMEEAHKMVAANKKRAQKIAKVGFFPTQIRD